MELCAFAATLPRIRALTQDFSANCLVVDCRAPVAPIASHGPTRIPPLGVVSPGQRVTALRERLMMRKCTLVRDERRTAPIPHGTNRAGDVVARAPQPTRGLRCRAVFRRRLVAGRPSALDGWRVPRPKRSLLSSAATSLRTHHRFRRNEMAQRLVRRRHGRRRVLQRHAQLRGQRRGAVRVVSHPARCIPV
jgi:hypothetical protein